MKRITSIGTVVLLAALRISFAQPAPVPYGFSPFATLQPITTIPSYYSTGDTVDILSGGLPGSSDGYLYGLQSNLNSPPKYGPTFIFPGLGDQDSWVPSPVIGNDGTVYIVSVEGIVYAYTSSGALKWTYSGINLDGLHVGATPTIGSDTNLYVTTDDPGGVLYCIDTALGLPKWKLFLGQSLDVDSGALFTTLSLNELCLVDELGQLHFITPYGQEFTPLSTGSATFPSSSIGITPQGFLVVCTGDGNLLIDDPATRSQLWSVPLGAGSITASPVIGPGSIVYVGATGRDGNGNNFFALQLPPNLGQVPPTVIAATSLMGRPTTAAVGTDSSVYVNDDAGFMYSLKEANGSFTIQWQSQPVGPFTMGPLLALVGTAHNVPVVFSGSQDMNVYAFNASAGPNTLTWSTFQGNDQRQGNWGGLRVRFPQVINAQFAYTNAPILKTGKAAYGNGTNDHWNAFLLPAKGAFNPSLSNLADSSNHVTGVGISIAGTLHAWTPSPPFNDNMMKGAGVSYNGATATITISGLSSTSGPQGALYDIYLYGYAGQATVANQVYSYNCVYTISPSAQNPLTGQQNVTTAKTASSANWSLTQWNEGDEYIVFRNVPVSQAGQVVTITMSPDMTNPINSPVGYSVINGIQIVAKQ